MSGREVQVYRGQSEAKHRFVAREAVTRVLEDDRFRRVIAALRALKRRWPDWLSVEVAALAAISAVLGRTLVRAHWSSIWMDREFTGWVSGAALRLGEGHRLYTDGAHSPLPPLSFCFVYLISGGQPRWIIESTANFVFQALTLLTMWLGMRRYLPRSAALIGCATAGASFFSLPKQLLYDSMAQFFVAVAAAAVTRFLVVPVGPPRPETERRIVNPWAVLAAGAFAACVLTKHSTAFGLGFGIVLAVLVARTPRSFGQRLIFLLAVGLGGIGFAALGLGLLAHWVDPRGFLEDVIRFGSESKGGFETLRTSLRNMASELWRQAVELAVPPVIVLFAVCGARSFRVSPEPGFEPERLSRRAACALACAAASALAYVAVVKLDRGFADTAMLAALFLAHVTLLFHRLADASPRWADALLVLACVTLPAALGHNLSVHFLRWNYDNNPLIVVVLATLAALAIASLGSPKRLALEVGYVVAVAVALQAMVSGGFNEQWLCAKEANTSWSEVRFLRGARLRPSADGMRTLVNRVREVAPNPDDSVLLLPNDPNVQAWFERPRPALSSLILFADQYRDCYVDGDLERLLRDPPRVIVIGPRDYWRNFSHRWQNGTGVERLIDRVVKELLPVHYSGPEAHEIRFQGGTQFMDVYVRRRTS